MMKRSLLILLILAACTGPVPTKATFSEEDLMNRIKGAWAGQAIGCTYGGPTEFKWCGRMIEDSVALDWPEHNMKWYFENYSGLYDDVYMDLTFVDVFDRCGLDAPVGEFATAFANAGYPLWHANQQARYNILQGIMPPESGYWENNPHADDIDFQIEADYAGIMCPGMPRAASYYSDAIGHMMNYGDGWYGGVYVANMYALAFVYKDIETVVREGLKSIPEQSDYYKCMSDVIRWHNQNPDDWKATWALVQENWADDAGCPDGVFRDFDIDATINSAYILIGLLYGQGDFEKTMEISTRCGQDSDCNPASAAGILGTMLGYDGIPEKFMANLREVEDLDFVYTTISLNDVYRLSYNQAVQVIERNGGKVDDGIRIAVQKPEPVRFEESFPGCKPLGRAEVAINLNEPAEYAFQGTGAVLSYSMHAPSEYVAQLEVMLDGNPAGTVVLPAEWKVRKQELYYVYGLGNGQHTLGFRLLNPQDDVSLLITNVIIYGPAE